MQAIHERTRALLELEKLGDRLPAEERAQVAAGLQAYQWRVASLPRSTQFLKLKPEGLRRMMYPQVGCGASRPGIQPGLRG